MKAHPEMDTEPRDWIRIHKPTGHRSTCTRSTALHRLYLSRPDIDPRVALATIEAGETFETSLARYEKGK